MYVLKHAACNAKVTCSIPRMHELLTCLECVVFLCTHCVYQHTRLLFTLHECAGGVCGAVCVWSDESAAGGSSSCDWLLLSNLGCLAFFRRPKWSCEFHTAERERQRLEREHGAQHTEHTHTDTHACAHTHIHTHMLVFMVYGDSL